MFIQLITINYSFLYYNDFDQAAGGLGEGSVVNLFFSLKGSTLRKILSFLPLHQPRTAHEYHLCILGDVHDVLQRCKICQLAEFMCVEPACSEK